MSYKCEKCGKIVGRNIACAIQHYEKGEDIVCFDCFDPEHERILGQRKALSDLKESLNQKYRKLDNMKDAYNEKKLGKIRDKIKNIKRRMRYAKEVIGINRTQ